MEEPGGKHLKPGDYGARKKIGAVRKVLIQRRGAENAEKR